MGHGLKKCFIFKFSNKSLDESVRKISTQKERRPEEKATPAEYASPSEGKNGVDCVACICDGVAVVWEPEVHCKPAFLCFYSNHSDCYIKSKL